jgi:HSP20 family protein
MTLIRYNSEPNNLVPGTFRSFIDRFFNDMKTEETAVNDFTPDVDIAESEKEFEVMISVPGMKKENFNIELEDGRLVISGERKIENKKEEKNFRSIETRYGRFSRSFYLPDIVNPDKISAKYEDGILNVRIPKNEQKIIKNRIEVK